jgi:hypothetical protein
MDDKESQGIVRDERGQEQPADKKRAQHVTSVEEKKKTEDEIQKTAEKKRVLEHVRRLSLFPSPPGAAYSCGLICERRGCCFSNPDVCYLG